MTIDELERQLVELRAELASTEAALPAVEAELFPANVALDRAQEDFNEVGQAEGTLPKGPSREERLLLEMYDIVESRVRRLPAGLEWQQITVRRTDHGLRVLVMV